MDEKERARALEATLGQIEKQFGKGSILRLGSKDAIVPVAVISSGSISLDAALGVGGFPRGRVTEIYGPESSGKTTIALQVVAEAQKKGGMAAFIDVEHALDPAYARKLGVDVDNLLVSQPDYGEQALEITGALIASGSIDVLVSRIRRKIEPDPQDATMIKTVRSGGYMFTPTVDAVAPPTGG